VPGLGAGEVFVEGEHGLDELRLSTADSRDGTAVMIRVPVPRRPLRFQRNIRDSIVWVRYGSKIFDANPGGDR
jgi:hypothetical protein